LTNQGKIVLAGGSGFLGTVLSRHFLSKGREVSVLTRGDDGLHDGISFRHWDPAGEEGWPAQLEGADVLINLAGKSIDCRFTPANKKAILGSRLQATSALGRAMESLQKPPPLWINAGTAGIYRSSLDAIHDESSTDYDSSFPAEVARAWEETFFGFRIPGVRQAALRISLVLGAEGILPVLARLTRLGLGGRQGTGRQRMAWIHPSDLARIVEAIVDHSTFSGPVNAAAPEPVTNAQFMRTLRKVLRLPFGLPAPGFAVRLGGALLGKEAGLVLHSMNVRPAKLIEAGFRYRFGGLEDALRDLLADPRKR
jgi:uncharacterized protein (TIGR01777 family)